MRFPKLVLASHSPRRAQILKLLGISFRQITPLINEEIEERTSPANLVKNLSRLKAESISKKFPHELVLGVDTIVVLNRKIFGKPVNRKQAIRILKNLQGKTHTVYSGICLVHLQKKFIATTTEKTHVTFGELSAQFIYDYVQSGFADDKAGAYGIQDQGAIFVKKVNGCFYNVMGLPVHSLYNLIRCYEQRYQR